MLKFEEFKNRKLNESLEEDIEIFQEAGIELDSSFESKINVSEDYHMLLYFNHDDECWYIALMPNIEDEDGITFGWENDDKEVELKDHGLIQGQYMNEEEKNVLKEFGLEIGKEYPDIISFWKHCKELEKKK